MGYGTVLADSMTTSSGASLGAGNATAFKNRLIDAGFIINQRVYVSGTALSAGTYAHDRWKAGASGCTYTFTQGSQGVPIQITITAGSLQQVIEGCNMAEGGTYVLSWTGTAQARFNGGTYGSSPLAITGITAGANVTIEFNTGTLKNPQVEVGSNATSFDYRPYGTELSLCQRYYYQSPGVETFSQYQAGTNSVGLAGLTCFPVTMRTTPTLTYGFTTPYSGNTFYKVDAGTTSTFTLNQNNASPSRVLNIYVSTSTVGSLGNLWESYLTSSAEL